MCGIVGAVNWGDRKTVLDMTEALAHRGPDDQGMWEGSSPGGLWAGLGHRRLSILDLSPAGHQPMSSEDGRFWIVYNGEVYNYRELRQGLVEKGQYFRSQSDTEVILRLYGEHGADCLDRLRGMFALGIWDREREELFLARDRLGVKPLYFAEGDRGLVFASEIKALLKHPGVGREIDFQAVDEYLTYLYIPPPRTIYREIRSLRPGHFLIWRDGRIEKQERYWRLPDGRLDGGETELTSELRRLLEETVRLRMISDVPVGAFLSGGLDSSAIVGLMARQTPHPIETFSIGFGARAHLYDELGFAREVSRRFSTNHHEIVVEPEAASLLPEMVRGFDEPFGNPTAFLVYLLSRFTRGHVKVALAGDGGDEVFGGYPRYLGASLSRFYRAMPRWMRRITFEPIASLLPESSRGRHGLRRFREFVEGSLLEPQDMYCHWVTYFSEEMKTELYSPETRSRIGEQVPYDFLKRIFREADQRERNAFFDRITAVDLQSFLPCNLLAYSDRMSMAHGLEVRVPFTDHRLIEFVTQLPPNLRLRGMRDKYLLKRALGDLLPEAVMKRKKLGFNPPMALWLREDLRDMVRDCLSPEAIRRRGYFRPEAVEALISQHQSGKRDLSLHLWALLVFETWHRMYIDP